MSEMNVVGERPGVEFPRNDPILRSLYDVVMTQGEAFNGGTCYSLRRGEYEAEVVFNEPFGNHLTVVTADRSVFVQWAFTSTGHSYVSAHRVRSGAKARRHAEAALACLSAETVDCRSEGF